MVFFLPCSFPFPVWCFLFPAWCFSVPGVFSPWVGVLFPVSFCFFPVSACLFPGVTGAQKSKWKQIIQAANGSKRICHGSRHAFAFSVCFQRCHFFPARGMGSCPACWLMVKSKWLSGFEARNDLCLRCFNKSTLPPPHNWVARAVSRTFRSHAKTVFRTLCTMVSMG